MSFLVYEISHFISRFTSKIRYYVGQAVLPFFDRERHRQNRPRGHEAVVIHLLGAK